MKAVRFHKHGKVDQLVFEDVPDLSPGPGEIVVKVRACALNHLDIWERQGLPGIQIPLPHISGSDVTGTIESIGLGIQDLKSGQKTLLCPGLSCLRCEFCYQGKENRCRDYSIIGLKSDGGYAEFIKVSATNALPYPDALDFFEAAAIPLVFMTAWHMLVDRCSIQPGETVLILGAGSGVGSAAIQIAKFFRACVIATVGSEAKLEKARALGADYVINHSQQKIDEEVKRITQKKGADIVFEHVGAATWEQSLASLAHSGRLVTCGATTGNKVEIELRHLFSRHITILGSYMGSRHELMEVLKLVQAGHLRPVVSHTLPLREAAQAQSILENRQHFGKVVLTM